MPNALSVSPSDEGRLDRFLATRFPAWSRTGLQRLINKRCVLVDDHPVSPNHKLKAGQKISIQWPDRSKKTAPVSDVPMPFPILFEDDEMMALNKPPQMVVHPAAGHHNGGTLVELVASKIGEGPWPDEMRPGLVHRLDRDTSGVILIAKTPEAHASLAKQFARRQVKKTYLSLVKGIMPSNDGTLECHIARHPGQRQRYAVSSSGRFASTKFHVIERIGGEATLVELYPLTGRTHQIRVQLSSYGFPILGDRIYGPPPSAGGSKKSFTFITRQLLHAHEIQFYHPDDNRLIKLTAPLPADFQEALKVIRLRA